MRKLRLTLAEVKQRVSKLVPQNIDYEVDVEAGSIAIITKQPEAFGGAGQSLTVKIAKNVKRRVIVRPHSDILADEKTVRQKVNEIIPPEAEVRNICLDPAQKAPWSVTIPPQLWVLRELTSRISETKSAG